MENTCPVCETVIEPGAGTCPVCGFRLQGATQKFTPIMLGEDVDEMAKPPSASKATLTVVRGPQTGVTYRVGDDIITIGRNPNCTIFLNDMTVSRMHATIEFEGDTPVIRDQDSFNGVWINNKNVESKALTSGDLIQIGTFCLKYSEGE